MSPAHLLALLRSRGCTVAVEEGDGWKLTVTPGIDDLEVAALFRILAQDLVTLVRAERRESSVEDLGQWWSVITNPEERSTRRSGIRCGMDWHSAELTGTANRLLNYLDELDHGDGVAAADWARAVRVSRPTFRRHVLLLEEKGLCRRGGSDRRPIFFYAGPIEGALESGVTHPLIEEGAA